MLRLLYTCNITYHNVTTRCRISSSTLKTHSNPIYPLRSGAGITKVSLRAASILFVCPKCVVYTLCAAATRELSVIYWLADMSALQRDNQFEFSVTRLHTQRLYTIMVHACSLDSFSLDYGRT